MPCVNVWSLAALYTKSNNRIFLKEFGTLLSKIIAERLFILLTVCLGFISNTKAQSIERQLYEHAWQQRPIANIIWNFQKNGEFVAMYVLVSNKSKKFSLSGFIFKKGTFTTDDSTKIVRVSFDSSYSVFSSDSSVVKKDSATQDWHLISVTNHKIVLIRPPVWDFEKGCNQNEGKNIIVTMYGGKKQKAQSLNNKISYVLRSRWQKYFNNLSNDTN